MSLVNTGRGCSLLCEKGRELGVGQLVKFSESLVLLPERELVWYIINKCAVC